MGQKYDDKVTYEKGKLHIRYLFIIAVILAVIGISIALGGNSEALGQISMASTVSSIILSSIAIFMSISGENKLNYTHDKLLETSEKMSDITADIEKANSLLNTTINQKLFKIDDIFNRLEQIGQSVDNVEKEVLNRALRVNEDSSVNISNDILWKVYNEIIAEQDGIVGKMVEKIMEYFIVACSENEEIDNDNLMKYVDFTVGDSVDLIPFGMAIGIFYVFITLGVTKGATVKYFKEKMALSEKRWNEIRKCL